MNSALRFFACIALFFFVTASFAADKFVLTGPPGAGKTSIIEELKRQGYKIFPEAFQFKYSQALQAGKADILSADLEGFQNSLVQQQLQWESSLVVPESVFFDRGTIDALGYFKFYKTKMTPEHRIACLENQYRMAFFIEALPKKLYQQNNMRHESYEEAVKTGEMLAAEYGMENERNGLTVILIPSMDEDQNVLSVSQRTELVLNHVKALHLK